MRPIKLLVVDDEQMVRTFVKTVVAKEKLPVAHVLEADNGLDAIALTRQYNPELILLDIHMPGVDGLHAAETIINENKNAYIVIVSAYNDFEYARSAFRMGVMDYLLKPIRPGEIMNLILKVAAQCSAAINNEDINKSQLVIAVEEFVEKNLERDIQLKDIAQAAFISPSHLSRKFRQLTGKAIVDYVQEVRLNKAETLLSSTDLSITEIAGKVGFNDASYFATCFKNHMRVTPLQYRKKHCIKG